MINYLYILVILFNLNLLLNFYIEVMLKVITLFNYKNTTSYLNNFFLFDIMAYRFYKNKYFSKLLISLIK